MSKTIGVVLALQDKCSPQLNKIADKLGITEKEAKKLHNQVNRLSKQMADGLKKASQAVAVGVGAVAAATSVMINKAVEAGDRIDKMSQKMQMSRQTFQELDYVFSQNGADISMMQGGMSKLAKAMEGARTGTKANVKTFQQLGISLKDSNGQLKSTENVMLEAISSLQKMPDGAQKTALSMQLFGKSATELQPLLNKNAKSVDELRQKFKDLGMGMSDDQIDAAVKFKDTMDTIQRTFAGLMNQIGADLLPAFQSLADKLVSNMPKIKATVTPILTGIINATKFLIENFDGLIPVIEAVVAGFATFKIITFVAKAMSALKIAIIAVRNAQLLLNYAWAMNPIGLIAVGLAGLVTVLVYLQKKFQIFTKAIEKFKQVASGIKNVFSKGGESNTPQNLPKHATGTSFAQGGLSLVGERGAELVDLPRGAKVYNNSDTQKMLGSNVTVNVNIGGNLWGTQEFLNEMKMQLGRELRTVLNT